MDIVDQLKAFVATAQTGSFTGAAEQIGISNRLTSKYVAELETRLGVRLFQRTTRKVGLTPAGEDLFARAPALLDEFDEMLADIREDSRGFTGMIRISAPVTFGEIYVNGMLGRFGKQNPELTLDLRLDDRYVDLASEGIDLAFRLGQVNALTLKARKLGEFRSLIAASPEYLARNGTPAHPDDLKHHCCIIDTNLKTPRRWIVFKDRQEIVVSIDGQFQVNSASAACNLARAGHGVVYSPSFALRDAIDAGELVPLMTSYQTSLAPINAVYLEGRALPKKVRALIDFALIDIRTENFS